MSLYEERALNRSIGTLIGINHMAAGNPTANLVQALATIANAFSQNQSGPNAPLSQTWSTSVTSVASSVSQAGSRSTNANATASNAYVSVLEMFSMLTLCHQCYA